ncbi:RNA polymerase sigma factor WhiG [Limnochorda pilosa]|uniref:RNA polymerase sigma factor n=1 Tax=Limnochorda pilosa TaxID=1555112 RepID=A0A0K2SK79_LIMPI|nr:RNA polymerase sigma factor WhiG [Limnochorda pilosa]BAS27521.1 RNA polymerase sigma 70 [Limnochorda pilosa]
MARQVEARAFGESELWQAFKQTRDPEVRERLILRYASLVKYVAGRIAIGLPRSVDFDDLLSYGIFGLIDAVEKFDPQREVKFETYAIARIRGAILDGLRSTDWIPRSVRQKARELEETVAALESRLGRAAGDAEIAAALHLSMDEYHQLLSDIQATTVLSLEEAWSQQGEEEGLRVRETVADPTSEDPEERIANREMKAELVEALDRLPERERLVITLYYYEGLTLKEIGRVLGVSESRISQIHTKAVVRLRAHLS